MLEVIEILGRSEQGQTEPFICRCNDNEIYFIKGLHAGRTSQVHEWVGANMAAAFGLPIPPFAIVNVDEVFSLTPEGAGLGSGPAFASQKINVTELSYMMVKDVPVQLQRDVLAFDWWIKNPDRWLSESGGNPNLFWDPKSSELVVIDHNLAFDTKFNPSDFLSYHVFKDQAKSVFDDMVSRLHYEERFDKALKSYDSCAAEIPDCWSFNDLEMTVPANWLIDTPCHREILAGFKLHNFWRAA